MKFGIDIYVDDMVKMRRFYTDVFDLEDVFALEECPESDEVWSLLVRDNFEINLYLKRNPDMNRSHKEIFSSRADREVVPVFYLNKPMKSIALTIEACGGRAEVGSRPFDGHYSCTGFDCDGNRFVVKVPETI